MTPVALRTVNDVSYVMRTKYVSLSALTGAVFGEVGS